MIKLSENARGMLLARYRAVLQNMFLKGSGALVLCGLLAFAPAEADAATIVYDDAQAATGAGLQTTPTWFTGSSNIALFPGITNNPGFANNTVTVNYDPTTPGVTNPDRVFGGLSDTGNVTGNTVYLLNGTVGSGSNGFVYGGRSYGGGVSGNTVLISGGTVDSGVYGGFSGSGSVSGNTVLISGGTVGYGYGYGFVYGGVSDGSGDVSGNTVLISGGTVGYSVYGGFSGSGSVSGNTVLISGGTVGYGPGYGFVYGGYGSGGSATDNTVTISGSPDLERSNIYGGSGGGADVFSGNTFNVYGFTGRVRSINNFEKYGFFLPSSMADGGTLLTTDTWTNPSGSTAITVNGIGIAGGGTPLKDGDTIKLIAVTGGSLPTNPLPQSSVKGMKGVSLLYDFNLDMGNISANALTAIVDGDGTLNPQTKAFSEGRLASLGFVNRGAELIAGEGMADALANVEGIPGGRETFGALSYGSSRYRTGSYADVRGVNLLAGLAWRSAAEESSLVRGVFLEGGWGSYDTYNSFTGLPSVRADGDASYYGLGALIRRDRADGSYVEGSLRGGQSRTTFRSGDLQSNIGQDAAYTAKPAYYGAHLGLGRVKGSNGNTVDYYAKYFYTHQNGDDVSVVGDPVSFSASDSHRLRGGVRLSHTRPDGRLATYYGAAYEHEFGGEADATVYGMDIDAPSIRGGTGIMELGLCLNTDAENRNTLNVSLQGYVGERSGLGGTIQFKRVF